MEKSPDAFRTISEVADWLNTPAHVLRFWESRFTQVKPVKRAGGRRYYRPADIALLGGIKKLLHDDGMTIRGVQKVLRTEGVRYVASLSPQLDDGAPMEELAEDHEASAEILDFASDAEVTPPDLGEQRQPAVEPAEPAEAPPAPMRARPQTQAEGAQFDLFGTPVKEEGAETPEAELDEAPAADEGEAARGGIDLSAIPPGPEDAEVLPPSRTIRFPIRNPGAARSRLARQKDEATRLLGRLRALAERIDGRR